MLWSIHTIGLTYIYIYIYRTRKTDDIRYCIIIQADMPPGRGRETTGTPVPRFQWTKPYNIPEAGIAGYYCRVNMRNLVWRPSNPPPNLLNLKARQLPCLNWLLKDYRCGPGMKLPSCGNIKQKPIVTKQYSREEWLSFTVCLDLSRSLIALAHLLLCLFCDYFKVLCSTPHVQSTLLDFAIFIMTDV